MLALQMFVVCITQLPKFLWLILPVNIVIPDFPTITLGGRCKWDESHDNTVLTYVTIVLDSSTIITGILFSIHVLLHQ